MCSLFIVPRSNINNKDNIVINNNMDQSFQGDLTDILRGSTNSSTSNNNNSGFGDQLILPTTTHNDWLFTSSDHHNNNIITNANTNTNTNTNTDSYFPSLLEDHHQAPSMTLPDMDPMPFGDPFSNMRDPLGLHGPGPTSFFGDPTSPGPTAFFGAAHSPLGHHLNHHQDASAAKFSPSCNIFSRMLQINPAPASAVGPSSPAPAANAAVGPAQCDINNPSAAAAAAAASPRGVIKAGDGLTVAVAAAAEGGGMQISSPRNPGIKRRKSQAKKVVCIPAPAAANSRASGEVVPSDLWAWRKYGQKPIKGSPYPRGYYRCSSSKGCSARKQVERSRTDPNMLVITYTSEHNHPWPTQRNALAGSTRSQPSKTTTSSSSSKTSPITISHSHSHAHQLGQVKTTSTSSSSPKEELKMDNNNASVSTTSASVKEESFDHSDRLDDDDAAFSTDVDHEGAGFGYRPSLCSNDVVHGNNNDHDAFFAELGEIEADPLKLLFSQGFASSVDHQQQHHKGLMVTGNSNNNINDNKGLDPFAMFDWSESNNDDSDNKQSN